MFICIGLFRGGGGGFTNVQLSCIALRNFFTNYKTNSGSSEDSQKNFIGYNFSGVTVMISRSIKSCSMEICSGLVVSKPTQYYV